MNSVICSCRARCRANVVSNTHAKPSDLVQNARSRERICLDVGSNVLDEDAETLVAAAREARV